MRAQVTLKHAGSEQCKKVIIRNLARIMDMRVVDFNPEARLLTFLCADANSLARVKEELSRLGFPIQHMSTTDATTRKETIPSF